MSITLSRGDVEFLTRSSRPRAHKAMQTRLELKASTSGRSEPYPSSYIFPYSFQSPKGKLAFTGRKRGAFTLDQGSKVNARRRCCVKAAETEVMECAQPQVMPGEQMIATSYQNQSKFKDA